MLHFTYSKQPLPTKKEESVALLKGPSPSSRTPLSSSLPVPLALSDLHSCHLPCYQLIWSNGPPPPSYRKIL